MYQGFLISVSRDTASLIFTYTILKPYAHWDDSHRRRRYRHVSVSGVRRLPSQWFVSTRCIGENAFQAIEFFMGWALTNGGWVVLWRCLWATHSPQMRKMMVLTGRLSAQCECSLTFIVTDVFRSGNNWRMNLVGSIPWWILTLPRMMMVMALSTDDATVVTRKQ